MKRVIRQWLGAGGALSGTDGRTRLTLLYSFAAIAILVAAVNTINVISAEESGHSLVEPVIWEGSSWLSLLAFLWIPWMAWRWAPPSVRPRWKLILHAPAALAFSVAHVGGFDLLRILVYRMAGAHYAVGPFATRLQFEMRKDVLGYALFIGLFSLIDHLLRRPDVTPSEPTTFDIRDGAKLTRVKMEEILAVTSAGNYVEFILGDGRRLLMRAPLRSVEEELAPRGFVRTHRSWLVNAGKVTTLKPEGSGDYTVELGKQSVPLSRRFPDALAKLRAS
ncbi:MAG: response regulator transcription factor [Alphaproteobacteria bacterium]|nr:response regulator transcription factor [Alphaproteobacteria bacterium]